MLAWLRLPAPAPSDAPEPGASLSAGQTPAPAATQERTAREAAYDKDVAALTALLDSGAADEETRAQAAERLDRLVADHQSELGLEEALNQAGYSSWCGAAAKRRAHSDRRVLRHDRRGKRRHPFALHRPYRHRVENIRIMARGGALTPSRRHASPHAPNGAIMGR